MDSCSKACIERLAERGHFLDIAYGYRCFADLDGAYAAMYLRNSGFDVVEHGDNGNNGYALTSCGVLLSTNGWVTKRK